MLTIKRNTKTENYLDSLSGPTDADLEKTESWIEENHILEDVQNFDSLQEKVMEDVDIYDR
jgi:hypothetical protein